MRDMIMRGLMVVAVVMFMFGSVQASDEFKQPSELASNDWFIDHFTCLVRDAIASPAAPIEIIKRSDWMERYVRGCKYWLQAVSFHFSGVSVKGQERSGVAVSVYFYNPVTLDEFILTPEAAAEEVSEGMKQFSSI